MANDDCSFALPITVPWARCQKFSSLLYTYKFFEKPNNRAEELYCDATIFVFRLFIVYSQKKMKTEKRPMAQGLLPIYRIYIEFSWYSFEKKNWRNINNALLHGCICPERFVVHVLILIKVLRSFYNFYLFYHLATGWLLGGIKKRYEKIKKLDIVLVTTSKNV